MIHRAVAVTSLLIAIAMTPRGSAQVFVDLGSGQATSVSPDSRFVTGTNGGGAFIWQPGIGFTPLGQSGGDAISDDGSVVAGDMATEAGLWTGSWTGLGGLGPAGCPDLSSCYDMSGAGDIVVGLGWNGCTARAFRWESSTGMVNLGSLDGQSSRANTISRDGTHIGGWDEHTNGTRRASVWWPNGTETLILEGSPGNAIGAGEVWGMNQDGSVIVGQGAPNAFRWSAADGLMDLGPAPGAQPGDVGVAYAVTDDGLIAVGSSGSFFNGYDSFIWVKGEGMRNLESYATSQGVVFPGGTVLAFSLDMTPSGKTIVGQSGVFPFSNGFVLVMQGVDKYCSNASPANILDLSASSSAKIGNPVTFDTANVPAAATTTLTIASAKHAELQTLGGVLLVDLTLSLKPFFTAPVVAGSSSFTVNIPNDPSIVGLVAYMQSLCLDPAQTKGWALSNGLRLVISGV